jgi:hypothetical protein
MAGREPFGQAPRRFGDGIGSRDADRVKAERPRSRREGRFQASAV